MATTIKPNDQEQIRQINEEIAKVDAQANLDQSVKGDDARLTKALNDLEALKSTYSSDPTIQAEFARMIGDVQNLQGIAGSEVQNSDASNHNWENQVADLTALLTSYATTGDGSGMVQNALGTEMKAAELPADSEAAQAAGKVYDLHTDPKTYLEADDATKQYSIYDAAGARTQQFSYEDASKYGVAMGTGQTIALHTKNFESSWLMNGDGGRQMVGANSPSTTAPAAASATILEGSIAGANNGPGPGTAYKAMAADAKPLPGKLAELQKNQQVNFLSDAQPPVYITSDNASPIKYTVYAEDGETVMQSDMEAPFAVGLNNGDWFAGSAKGVASAWTTTDPKSLDAATKLFDLNGASANGGKLVARGTPNEVTAPADASASAGGIVVLTEAQKATLPGDLNKTKDTVFKIDTNPPSYIKADGESYETFDPIEGKKTMGGTLRAEKGDIIALNNGRFLALDPSGAGEKSKIYDKFSDIPGSDKKSYMTYGGTPPMLRMTEDTKSTTPTSDTKAVTGHSLLDKDKEVNGGSIDGDGLHKDGKGRGYKFWAGSEGSDGKVYANVFSKDKAGMGEDHDTDLRDEGNKNITPDELKTGAYGIFNFKNGAQYVSMDPASVNTDDRTGYSGYFMVSGDKIVDVVTGQAIPKATFEAARDAQKLTAYEQKDETEEAAE